MAKERIKHIAQPHRWLIAALMACMLATSFSCGNDEPDLLVGYYLNIQSQVNLNLSDYDESQGTSATTSSSVLSTTIVRMRKALEETYPIATYQGNDSGVLAACDSIYRNYKLAYSHLERNTVCVVKLYRTRLDGEAIVSSRCMTTYLFGIIPETINPPE
ncbi:MAG: hypothetical protein IJK93_10800 [Muribaculaceae bacterium]|jgi:hypothetical protein|nr:hypothetical protein [Muribaculaceae bacterium]